MDNTDDVEFETVTAATAILDLKLIIENQLVILRYLQLTSTGTLGAEFERQIHLTQQHLDRS